MLRILYIILRYLYHTVRYYTIAIVYPNLLHWVVRFVNLLRRNCAKIYTFFFCVILISVIFLIATMQIPPLNVKTFL